MTSILRLTQFTEAEDQYRVEVALEGDGQPRQTATSRFDFKLTPQDHEDLRWYLEDYLQYPLDPAPTIAARIEQRMNDIGTDLFKAVFQSSDDSRDLWATLRGQLNDARVEINTEVREATGIPWELGLKFYRQYPLFFDYLGKETFFIADFFCHERKLMVKIDGKIHDYRKDHDELRTFIINMMEIEVIRFRNEEIENNLSEVLARITRLLEKNTMRDEEIKVDCAD